GRTGRGARWTAICGRPQGGAGATLGFGAGIAGTLGARGTRRLARTAGNDAHAGRTGIALAGRRNFLGAGLCWSIGLGRCIFLDAAHLVGLTALFFETGGFFAHLAAAIVILDAARFLGDKTLAVL